MTTMQKVAWAVLCAVVLTAAGCAPQQDRTATPAAVVEKLDIGTRKPAFGGASFGTVGTYEYVAGVVTVRLDPRHPANRAIVDVDKAADADGFVRYRTDVVLLRPASAAAASRVLIFDIANRGNKLALVRLNDGANQFDTAAQAGNGWAMRQGHALLWVGWQGDVPLGTEGRIVGTRFPVATEQGRTITGTSLEEFIFDDTVAVSSATLTYPAASLDPARATLTVRARPGAPATSLPATAWRYVNESEIAITRPAGFDGGAVCQFVYEARDPVAMGLGLSAVRDVVAFLKSGDADASGRPHPLSDVRPDVTVAMGISQSGRYSRQHEDHWFAGDQFPFSSAVTTDPVSGRTDGIFARCRADATCPKTMHLDSNLEFWQARASLVVTDGTGLAVVLPDDVRAYLMASTQHGPAATPAAGICQQLNNPAQQSTLVRALMPRLIEWARTGKAPPPSRFPDLANGGLVPPARAAMGFPDLAGLGVRFPEVINELTVVDYAVVPPRPDPARRYGVQVPRTDADGHDLDGVRLPDVDVPLATHSGWGLRKAGFAEGNLCGLNGVYVPLSRDAAERGARRDPRPSLAERYATRDAYVKRVRAASERLVAEGFMLDEDVARWVERARNEPRAATLP